MCFATFPFSILLFPHYRSAPNPYPFPLLVSAGAHLGLRWRQFGLIPQLAAKTCSLQLLSPQLTALSSCCALPEGCRGNSQLWAYLLSHPLKSGARAPAPHLQLPNRSCRYFFGRARLGKLWALELQHRAGAGLIRLWNSTETKGISSVERKACRRAVRIGVLCTTHEWKKENGNLFNEPVCFVI